MSLTDKLKPPAKDRGIGKSVPCPKCASPDAEHYSANYIWCPRCDDPKRQDLSRYSLDALTDIVSSPHDDEDEDTDPGAWSIAYTTTGNVSGNTFNPSGQLPTGHMAYYRCVSCYGKVLHHVDTVAAGAACHCGGVLWKLP